MKILANNFLNFKTNQVQKYSQNPINFKALHPQGDVLELSEYKQKENLSQTSKSDFQDIETKYQVHKNTKSQEKMQIDALTKELSLLHDNLNFEYEEFEKLYYYSMAPLCYFNTRPEMQKSFEQFYIKCTGQTPTKQTVKRMFSCFSACNWSLSPHKPLQENTKLLKLKLKNDIDSLKKQSENLSKAKDFKFKSDDYSTETFIDLFELDNFKKDSPLLLKKFLDKVKIDDEEYIVNSQKNKDFLAQFKDHAVYSSKNIERLGIPFDGIEQIFPECTVTTLQENTTKNKRKKNPESLISFPNGHPIEKIMQDGEEQKTVCSFTKKYYRNLPFRYVKYSAENESKPYDYIFIDKENPDNKRIMDFKANILNRIAVLPFRYTTQAGITFVDTNDEFNKKLMQRDFIDPTPKRSEYSCIWDTFKKGEKQNVPVEYLEKLGFGKTEDITKLIETGKLKGEISPIFSFVISDTEIETDKSEWEISSNKKSAFVTFDPDNEIPLFGECNTTILRKLRDANPKTKSLKEVANALKISQKSLEYAIIDGDVEIIPEYIFVSDNKKRYIDISTPKNQEFIKKIRFERELEKSLRAVEREENQKAKIANQDLKQRLSSLRMALAWEFMPNTRMIGSELATQDGHLCKLIAKETLDKDSLTDVEEAKINSYRRELWTMAGSDELKQAHQKANAIMKEFKANGLSNIDEELLPIFAKYGFE